MIARIVAALVLSIFWSGAHATEQTSRPEQYICVANKLSGFEYKDDTKMWGPVHSRSDRKYLIAPASGQDVKFQVTEVGKNAALGFCKGGFNDSGHLFCDVIGGEFKINKTNGRFLLSYLAGYYDVGSTPEITDETSDMPFLEIGKCSRF